MVDDFSKFVEQKTAPNNVVNSVLQNTDAQKIKLDTHTFENEQNSKEHSPSADVTTNPSEIHDQKSIINNKGVCSNSVLEFIMKIFQCKVEEVFTEKSLVREPNIKSEIDTVTSTIELTDEKAPDKNAVDVSGLLEISPCQYVSFESFVFKKTMLRKPLAPLLKITTDNTDELNIDSDTTVSSYCSSVLDEWLMLRKRPSSICLLPDTLLDKNKESQSDDKPKVEPAKEEQEHVSVKETESEVEPAKEQKHVPVKETEVDSAKEQEHVAVKETESEVEPAKEQEHVPVKETESEVDSAKEQEHVAVKETESEVEPAKEQEHVAVKETESEVEPAKEQEHVPVKETESEVDSAKEQEHVAVKETESEVEPAKEQEHVSVKETESEVEPAKEQEHVPVKETESEVELAKEQKHVPVKETVSEVDPAKELEHVSVKESEVDSAKEHENVSFKESEVDPTKELEHLSKLEVKEYPESEVNKTETKQEEALHKVKQEVKEPKVKIEPKPDVPTQIHNGICPNDFLSWLISAFHCDVLEHVQSFKQLMNGTNSNSSLHFLDIVLSTCPSHHDFPQADLNSHSSVISIPAHLRKELSKYDLSRKDVCHFSCFHYFLQFIGRQDLCFSYDIPLQIDNSPSSFTKTISPKPISMLMTCPSVLNLFYSETRMCPFVKNYSKSAKQEVVYTTVGDCVDYMIDLILPQVCLTRMSDKFEFSTDKETVAETTAISAAKLKDPNVCKTIEFQQVVKELYQPVCSAEIKVQTKYLPTLFKDNLIKPDTIGSQSTCPNTVLTIFQPIVHKMCSPKTANIRETVKAEDTTPTLLNKILIKSDIKSIAIGPQRTCPNTVLKVFQPIVHKMCSLRDHNRSEMVKPKDTTHKLQDISIKPDTKSIDTIGSQNVCPNTVLKVFQPIVHKMCSLRDHNRSEMVKPKDTTHKLQDISMKPDTKSIDTIGSQNVCPNTILTNQKLLNQTILNKYC
ncbi:uncharacterized protein [Antedon mediterranea]|uniref:uncharacterized protein n=1 Tax=Antedon mediterranea TaxID=105859 RepID=UPI003AF5A782